MRAPISVRYPLVEALVGFLFLGAFVIDVIAGPRTAWGQIPVFQLAAAAYHCIFLALLVAATFIDYDLMIIPDQITVTGMIAGLGLGTLWPEARPTPGSWPAITHLQGFWVGLAGLLVGAGLDPIRPQDREFCLAPRGDGIGRCHAHGNDRCVSGLASRGSHFFPGSFPGIDPRGMEVDDVSGKAIERTTIIGADREIPYGPYLSMAAASLLFVWRWLWPISNRQLFEPLYVIFWWMWGIDVDLPK